jgi:hypothetical protein
MPLSSALAEDCINLHLYYLKVHYYLKTINYALNNFFSKNAFGECIYNV